MPEQRGYPIQTGLFLILMIGGGWYFIKNFEVDGLDHLSVRSKPETFEGEYVSFAPNRSNDATSEMIAGIDAGNVNASRPETRRPDTRSARADDNPFLHSRRIDLVPGTDTSVISKTYASRFVPEDESAPRPERMRMSRQRYRNLKIASWAMNGFGPSKLRDNLVRKNVVRILRQFDVIALQQVQSIESDLLPRLVDAINEGQSNIDGVSRYDYILGPPSDQRAIGSASHGERLAFVFDTTAVEVDRTQTYTVADPTNRITHDPVVAWFRAAEPHPREAWTFSLVNVRIELNRAKEEVALLPSILASVRKDGRGEDDVVMAGLFQADDAYLIPTIAGRQIQAAVRSLPTDVYGLHQTANLLIDQAPTTEFLGRGGPLNFVRVYSMTVTQAESVSPNLPVYAEFTAVEGGHP